MTFKPVTQDLFFSRNDPQDRRLGELARPCSQIENAAEGSRSIAIVGYPDDEGIQLNGGRPGAAQAPDRIRKYLYRMTPSALSPNESQVRLFDLGNLDPASGDIAKRHQSAQANVASALAAGHRVLSFGGGHDYGFPDGAAFAAECARSKGQRPLVLNFDAHLDVRPMDKGLTSGTPFFRLLETYPEIDFAEIGIQSQCNSRAHLDWAKARGAKLLSHEEWMMSGESLAVFVSQRLEDWLVRPRPVFLSIDIDGFSNAFAMGCSQSWATGFSPDEFFRLLHILLARLDVRAMGIYEVSPPLDQDDKTSKLAALIAHRFIYPL